MQFGVEQSHPAGADAEQRGDLAGSDRRAHANPRDLILDRCQIGLHAGVLTLLPAVAAQIDDLPQNENGGRGGQDGAAEGYPPDASADRIGGHHCFRLRDRHGDNHVLPGHSGEPMDTRDVIDRGRTRPSAGYLRLECREHVGFRQVDLWVSGGRAGDGLQGASLRIYQRDHAVDSDRDLIE